MPFKPIAVTLLTGMFTAVAAATPQALALEPIKGSITYGGDPSSRLIKAPIGSTVPHEFSADGSRYRETYVVKSDRRLLLVSRSRSDD